MIAPTRIALASAVFALQGGARPPTGSAGGDLTGTYPNPSIGSNAVGSGEVQDDALSGTDVAANGLAE